MIALITLLVMLSVSASTLIEYEWWAEVGQTATWWSLLWYRYVPPMAVSLVALAVFWLAWIWGRRRGQAQAEIIDIGGLLDRAWFAPAVLLLPALIVGAAVVDPWTLVQYAGARGLAAVNPWRDPVFGQPLGFYLFDLPFYLRALLALVVLTVAATAVHLTAALVSGLREFKLAGPMRALAAVGLMAYAARLYLGRYELLFHEHGFLTGIDYVDETIRLPLVWVSIAAWVLAAALVLLGRYVAAVPAPVVAAVLSWIVPPIVSAVYVKPNEISLERPYIERHIAATRAAYGLEGRSRTIDYPAKAEAKIDLERNRAALENVRLWDWRAFRDTVSQIQPLRPYLYRDIDVDRYEIDGRIRQVMVAPRELEIDQIGEARRQWINPRFIYTHGYGLVVAEANKITANGLPYLFIQNAPPEVRTASLKVTRPELYFSQVSHEPVFVNTGQQEFDYPSGSDNVYTKYLGKGGIPMTPLMRFLAAAAYGERNILLTSYLHSDSRMMIHRQVEERLDTLAPFIQWDQDPYLVVTQEGRLVWMVDGYLTTDRHPYSAERSYQGFGRFNYVRNSVKATVDAYEGATAIYVWDESDPLVNAYRNLFPSLFKKKSEMPADLVAHTRYAEFLFQVQADVDRTYHMRDPENFYNKSDLWEIARYVQKQGERPAAMPPVYLIAELPGETKPEFLLMLPFTPRGKDNLIGYMAARCDPPHQGELVFLQLPKQEVLLGPMQIEARIDQDEVISKDLTLWNQQGSQVLRGQTLVLPVDNTFLYIKPLYLQASNARMPQLKKVVVAMGNTLIYEDSYEAALRKLTGGVLAATPPAQEPTRGAPPAAAATPDPKTQLLIERIQRLRKELDGLEAEIRKK